jgi:hypothetical protein
VSEWDAFPAVGAAGGSSPLRITVTPRDRDLAIRTVLGEAGNQPDEGMAGVAAVIRNRVQAGRYGGEDIPSVISKPWAFEPWMTQKGRDRMYSYAPDSEPYQRAAAAVDRAFNEGVDPTGGATHFFAPRAQSELGRNVPPWGRGEPLTTIGGHRFYAPEGRVQVARSEGATQLAGGSEWDAFPAVGAAAPQTQAAPQPAEGAGRSREAPPDIGYLGAAGAGLRSGAMLGFPDELAGLQAASGGVPDFAGLPTGKLVALARLGYEALAGRGQATEAYEQARDQERQALATAREQYPGTTLAGELAGGVATPIPGMAALRTAGMGARALGSAAAGAGVGALAGAGAGETGAERLSGAASGGLVGGLVGGVASPVLDVAARGGAAALREAGRIFPNVERRAAGMVDYAAREAQRVDPAARTRLTPAEAAATPESVVADIAGEPGRAVARWAANASPQARETLNAMIDPRFEGQAGRIVGWLNNTFHYPNATGQQQAIDQVERTVNRANYARAYRDGDAGLWSPELERLTSSPAVTQAMQAAATRGKDRAVTQGFGGFNPGVTFENGIVQFRRGPTGQPTYPNLQYWDYVKRELDDGARAAARGGRNEEASTLTNLATTLRGELDNLVPSYQEARQGAAHFFGAENALEAGQAFVTSRMGNNEARQALARMSPTERQLFQDGFVSRFIQQVNETGDRRNVLNTIASSPAARERLNIALGPQRSAELEAMLRVEGVMNFIRPAVQGNSTTARQLIEAGVVTSAGAYGGVGTYMSSDPLHLSVLALTSAFAARSRGTDRRVAQRVAEMLTSHDPAVFRRGLQLVARNQRFMDGIRGLDQRIARIGGQQGSGVPAVQSLGIGRAEQGQQDQ